MKREYPPPSIRIGEAYSCILTNFLLINCLIAKTIDKTMKATYSLWASFIPYKPQVGHTFPDDHNLRHKLSLLLMI